LFVALELRFSPTANPDALIAAAASARLSAAGHSLPSVSLRLEPDQDRRWRSPLGCGDKVAVVSVLLVRKPAVRPDANISPLKRHAMRFDFSDVPFRRRAFSEKPMSFIDQQAKNVLAAIIDVVAVETGNRDARDYWQRKQLQNLLEHATRKSTFWRQRIGSKKLRAIRLSDLPIQTRGDVIKQVEMEGSLLSSSGTIASRKHETSGSSGKPVQFFVSEMNQHYNFVRSTAQYFMEGRDLTLNRTRFKTSYDRMANGFLAKKTSGWLGPLSAVFKNGDNKEISYLHPDRDMLFKELAKDPVGYLVIQPRLVEALFYDRDVSFLADNGTKMWIPLAEPVETELRDKFVAAGILVRSNYSSEEVGYIGAECMECQDSFHVAESNVIIEIDHHNSVVVNGQRLGRVLVTQLHSYATPFVRYDIGDFATLSEKCRCGHDGPALANIYGRKKDLLKRADGTIVPFIIRGGNIMNIVKFDEFRVRQTELDAIDVEIGGIDHLSDNQTAALATFFKTAAGDEFKIRINAVRQIDWGADVKRLGFRNEVI
jgi:phenylacetate-CoA ligase